ncbi:hypothetical protein Lal_00001211 [Lupinus albus]|uniref:Uncharacterized protein n=1 Tax=Lupinus albus TaxID=3870 RepID=A0A6A5P1D8_LUPAL|nr:hypothetical protein Lalb_Chr18g0053531 [Lupinus albus]KAF1891073.1 hypothetical protein Lal_00001211 [Lupinus albus]
MLSKLFFLISLVERKKPKPQDTNIDELDLVKGAAWAWYQHGSGSESKAMKEFHVRRTQHAPGPSRYKLEAMRMAKESKEERPSIHPMKPLLDTYEIQSISRQLNKLIESSQNTVGNGKNSTNGGLDNNGSRNMKKKKRISKGFWPRHGVVCGSRDDVVDDTALRIDMLSERTRITCPKKLLSPCPKPITFHQVK